MNHPANNAQASNKLLQLTRARELELEVPDTLVPRSAAEMRGFWARCEGSMIAKPLSVGAVETPEGEVEAQIFTSAVGEEQIRHADDIALCPTLLQECIRSATNVRVTIVDGAITALGLLPPVGEAQEIDIRKHGLASVLYEAITLPRDLANRLLRLLESFQLRFAAIDLLRTRDDRWIFLEVNPNGQWAWMDILGVSDIGSTFVESACKAMR